MKDHFVSLRDDSHARWIVFLFVLIPIAASYILTCVLDRILQPSSLSAFITMYSLFTGLLLNVVVFLFNIVIKAGEDLGVKDPQSKTRKLIEHVYVNSLYLVLIAVATLCLLVLTLIVDIEMSPNLLLTIVSLVVYFITAHFLMTLLMVVKRLYSLLTEHIKRISS